MSNLGMDEKSSLILLKEFKARSPLKFVEADKFLKYETESWNADERRFIKVSGKLKAQDFTAQKFPVTLSDGRLHEWLGVLFEQYMNTISSWLKTQSVTSFKVESKEAFKTFFEAHAKYQEYPCQIYGNGMKLNKLKSILGKENFGCHTPPSIRFYSVEEHKELPLVLVSVGGNRFKDCLLVTDEKGIVIAEPEVKEEDAAGKLTVTFKFDAILDKVVNLDF